MRCNEGLAIGVRHFERLGEGTGYVVAGDFTPPAQSLRRLDPARSLLFGEAAGANDRVVEIALLEPLVGAGLGEEVRLHRLRAAAWVASAHGAEHQITSDRKSTRLNSSHANISYAVFCLKK